MRITTGEEPEDVEQPEGKGAAVVDTVGKGGRARAKSFRMNNEQV